MADVDYNVRAAKGQAFNLAVHDAISTGKQGDIKHIYALYIKYYELGQLIQNSTIENLKEALTS